MPQQRIVLTTILTRPFHIQLGLYNLKAYLQHHQKQLAKKIRIDIDIIQPDKFMFYQEDYWPYLDDKKLFFHAMQLLKKSPQIIGFSCFNWNIGLTLKLCRIIKKISPGVTILLGGPEVSFEPEKMLADEICIDLIIRDEGEQTFLEMLQNIFSGGLPLSEIKGLTFRLNNEIVNNPMREPLDLNEVPSPYAAGLIKPSNDLTMTIETSRGCPFRCTYCGYSLLSKAKLRFFPMKRVAGDLKILLSKKIRSLWINDDNFNINPPRAIAMLKYMIKYNKTTVLTTFLNASMWEIGDNLIRYLKKANMKSIIGVQSINDTPLTIAQRKNNMPKMEANLRRLDKHKMPYILQFIAALPGDTYEGLKKSVDWAYQYNTQQIQISLLRIIKGTYLYRNAEMLGLKIDKKKFQFHTYVTETKDISRKDMKKVRDIVSSVGLLYNMKLLRQTSRFFARTYSVPFSDFIAEWEKVIKIFKNNKKYLQKMQNIFIKHIAKKYEIDLTPHKKELAVLQARDVEGFINYTPDEAY